MLAEGPRSSLEGSHLPARLPQMAIEGFQILNGMHKVLVLSEHQGGETL
jgi:hypothetical protein